MPPAGFELAISRASDRWDLHSIWVYCWIDYVNYFHVLYGRTLFSVNCMTWILCIICAFYQILNPLLRFICSCLTDVIWEPLTDTTSGWKGRKFPSVRRSVMSNFVKTGSPNCETETANWNLHTGSLTVPADRYAIIFQKAIILL